MEPDLRTDVHDDHPSVIMPPPQPAQAPDDDEQSIDSDQQVANSSQPDTDDGQPSRVAWLGSPHRTLERQLYTSHLLSTANSRAFEFAAVLFLAELFPSTLQPLSVYALARGAAAVLLAQPVGACIDSCDRLAVVRASIVAGRAAVVGSCALFWALERRDVTGGLGGGWRDGLFAALCVLACVEKLAAMANTVAVERDWVVVMTDGDEEWRRVVNARLRRIDLMCKLLGPLAISVVAMVSTMIAVWTLLGINVVSVLVEYICIARVYKSVPALRRQLSGQEDTPSDAQDPASRSWVNTLLPLSSLSFYVRHRAFLPSLSLALLYLTVLSFSGQMITFLLSVGYTPLHVGVARTASTAVELAATWAAPRLVRRVGPVRGGIWSLSAQMVFLAAGVSWFLAGFDGTPAARAAAATGLAVCVAFSRLGLWGYDFCAQIIVQDEVEAEYRGTFSAVEAALQNLFELLSFATTIFFSRPDQFRWPVIISVVAVYIAGGLYTFFVRRRRGHLFHAPSCFRAKPEGPVALP